MVAQRDHICARGKNIVRLLWGNAPPGSVLAVDDHEIRAVFALDAAQQAVQGVNSCLTDHIANG